MCSKPAYYRRIWAALVMAPQKVAHLAFPGLGIPGDEDGFSSTEIGNARWYPMAGSGRQQVSVNILRFGGKGLAIPGQASADSNRLRFVPNRYWRARGVTDWEADVSAVVRSSSGWACYELQGGQCTIIHWVKE